MSPADVCDMPVPFDWTDRKTKWAWQMQVSPRTFEMELLFQRWLEKRALEYVRRNRENMTGAEYEASLDGCRRDATSGVYAFGGRWAWEALRSFDGFVYNAFLQLKKVQPVVTAGEGQEKEPPGAPQVTMQLVERIAHDEDAFRRLDLAIAQANDPNRARPAAGTDQAAPPASTSPSST
jgi:hypothetical protein